MAGGTVARRYSQAIFDMAKATNDFDVWLSDLDIIANTFAMPKVKGLLESPDTPRATKRDLVDQALRGQVTPDGLNFARLLVARNREHSLEAIRREFRQRVNAERHILTADVTTAVPVDAAEQKMIAERLAALVGQPGNQVEMTLHVDPEILGGLVARVGDKLIDGSVRTRLQQLKQQIAAQVYSESIRCRSG